MKALDKAASAAGATETLMIMRVDDVAGLLKPRNQVAIAPSMLAKPVEDENNAAR